MRCLVADASATTRALVSNVLRRAGAAEIVSHRSLAEALSACETPFDVAIVDRDLAAGPGWDWLDALRARACRPCCLLVIGSRVSLDEAGALRAIGAAGFLLKPLNPELLGERVRKMLAGAGGAAPPDDVDELPQAA